MSILECPGGVCELGETVLYVDCGGDYRNLYILKCTELYLQKKLILYYDNFKTKI
jgi:hypothetical protein